MLSYIIRAFKKVSNKYCIHNLRKKKKSFFQRVSNSTLELSNFVCDRRRIEIVEWSFWSNVTAPYAAFKPNN